MGAVGWPNTGVLVFPVELVERVHAEWVRWTIAVAEALLALGTSVYFAETISLVLALAAPPTSLAPAVPWEELPVQMNCQLNLSQLDLERNAFLKARFRTSARWASDSLISDCLNLGRHRVFP